MRSFLGNRDASQNNLEGPYTCGDFAPPVANANWTKYQRSQWTFQLQNNTWKGPKPFGDMIDAMWTMRGDSASHNGTSLSGNATNLANTKAWFLANYDMDQTLTSMALLEWLSIWDDAKQNQFYWRKASGKWMRLGWDYDGVMSTGGGGGGMGGGYTQSITGGEYGSTIFDGVNWWKDTFYKCFLTEYKQKLWKLNNSTLDKANLVALGFTTSSSCYTFANVRQANVNTQLALGTYYKPVTPTNSSPSSGGVVLSGASLATSAYSHPNGKAHTSTTWVIRSSAGNYEEPVFATTSTTNLTSLPIPYDHLTYGQTYYWHAMHTDADGHDSILSTETSFTWGTAATVAAGNLALNEILASNKNAATNGISHPDYVELVNNTASAISLTGVTLTNDVSVPGKYVFPSGNTIAAGAHLIVWCDTSATDPGLHSGFNLSAGGDTVLLMNGSTILDTVTFGPQAPDLSIGRIANGTGTWTATTPTPGATNSAATLGTTATLSVNEWMADPAYGDDWFELYNSGTNPVALAGLYLSDTPSTPAVTQIPVLSFIAAGGYTRFWADGSSDGGNHCNFKLSKSGESVVLTASNGTTTINKYTFGSQTTDVSQGRFPDGSSTIGTFAATASSEKPNWLASAVVINEALTHPADGSTAWIELRNTGASAANISYWWLSNDFNAPKKYQFPNGTSIPAGGYLVVEAATFGSAFTLDSTGGEICLSEGPSGGTLTGYRSQVKYGVAEAGVSFGRVECTGHNNGDNNTDFWPMQAATSGAVNSDPLTSPLQINEVMYHPTDGSGGADVTTTEFIEIHNRSNAAVTAAGWKLKGDVDFTFPSGTTLAPDGYLVVVGFNPSTDPTSLANFRTTYGLGAEAVIVGPFSTNLPNSTADLELAETVDYSGVLYYANVDKVEYRDLSPWPTLADGGGQSLQRASRSLIGNTASNWSGATPTPAALNAGLYTTLAIWTESPLPGATAFTSYSAQLVGVGGTTPYSWSLASGSLPGGLTLDSSGLIHGIPLSTGLVSFTVRITDHLAATTTLAMTINVTSSATDSDADGMPDAWESYYGMVNGINDAAIDSDADGQTNLAEYLAGTNPVSRTSVFRITSLTAPAGGHVTLAWSGVAGKTYRISSSPDLETWTDLGSTVTCSTTGTVSADVSVTGERRFLRVTVVP